MDFQIVSSRRTIPKGHIPIHHLTLPSCLAILEVPKKVTPNRGLPGYGWKEQKDEAQLWEWFDIAKANHRRLSRIHHPDKGGSVEKAAIINATWKRLKELMARRGL